VTRRVAKPRRRAPLDFQPWVSLSGAAKQNCLSILAAPLVFEETRGGAVPFGTRAEFSSAQLFVLEPYGLVTGLSYSYVYTNTDIDVVFRGMRLR